MSAMPPAACSSASASASICGASMSTAIDPHAADDASTCEVADIVGRLEPDPPASIADHVEPRCMLLSQRPLTSPDPVPCLHVCALDPAEPRWALLRLVVAARLAAVEGRTPAW